MPKLKRSTAELVREAIEEDLVVKQALQRGLLNVRALAREIQDTEGGEQTLGALISSIHRYPVGEGAKLADVGKYIAKLALRDKVTAFGIANTEQTWKSILRLSDKIEASKGDVLRVITGVEAITVIIDSKNVGILTSMVPAGNFSRTYENLAEVMVHLDEGSWESTGILSTLASRLALSGVNILYHFGYGPPPIIVFEVREDDAVTAYQALSRLWKSEGP